MDGERFDSLIKRLGTTRLTRLAALRGLAAGAVATLVGVSLTADEARAARKKARKIRICHRTSATDPGVTKRKLKSRAKKELRRHQFDTKGACTTAPGSTTINIIGCSSDAQCGVGRFCVGGICVQCRGNADCVAPRTCVDGFCNAPVTIINNPTTVVGLEICRQQQNFCGPNEFCCTSGPKTALCVNNLNSCNPGSGVPGAA